MRGAEGRWREGLEGEKGGETAVGGGKINHFLKIHKMNILKSQLFYLKLKEHNVRDKD